MYATQYEITLPATYDMGIIRDRVAAGGPLLDERAGLGCKAWLIRHRGVDGSPVNQYAPIYLWREVGAAAQFLAGGGGFAGIVRDFGRPVVTQWAGLACFAGADRGAGTPTLAGRRITPLPADPDGSGGGLQRFVAEEIEQARQLAGQPGVHTVALALDPHHWRLLRLVLGPDEAAVERYELLHLSAPELAGLPEGPTWAALSGSSPVSRRPAAVA